MLRREEKGKDLSSPLSLKIRIIGDRNTSNGRKPCKMLRALLVLGLGLATIDVRNYGCEMLNYCGNAAQLSSPHKNTPDNCSRKGASSGNST